MKFNFSFVIDLGLSLEEMAVIQRLWDKSHVNEVTWNCTQQAFFEAIVRCAKVAIPCYAVPSCVYAQAILESGWFSTGTMFGVKATSAQEKAGQVEEDKTHEVVNGKMKEVSGTFFHAGIQAQFGNYYAYITRRKPGTQQFLPADAAGFIDYLQNPMIQAADGSASGSYSTAGKSYSVAILSIIRSNNLVVFDHQ